MKNLEELTNKEWTKIYRFAHSTVMALVLVLLMPENATYQGMMETPETIQTLMSHTFQAMEIVGVLALFVMFTVAAFMQRGGSE